MSTSTRKPTSAPAAASAGESPRATAAESPTTATCASRGERGEPLRLGRADEREGEQDVAEAGSLHHFRLAELLARDPDRAGAHLHVRDRRQLVRLDVRPEREPVLVAVALHAGDIALDSVQVDRRDRGVELLDAHLDHRFRRHLLAEPDDRVALDVEADEIRLDRGARRHRVLEERAVLGVHLVEVLHVADVHAAANRVLQ